MNILDFLKRKPFSSFVHFLTRKDRYPASLKPLMFGLQNRLLVIHGFAKGYFSFTESLLMALPNRFKSEGLRSKFSKYTIAEINMAAKEHLKDFIHSDGSVDICGNTFYPAQGNFGELIDLVYQVFVLDQYEAKEYLVDDSVVIDAGANIGSFSVFAANLRKGLTIHSFEPVKSTFEVLRRNTSPYENVFCHNMGLGEAIARREIFFSKDGTVGSAFADSNDGHASIRPADELSEETQVMTIDGFVAENAVPRVDFIKIDTEGYEANILKGARETIKRFEPVITMSAYHKEEDKVVLPQIIQSISSNYDYKLVYADEVDIIFFPKKNA